MPRLTLSFDPSQSTSAHCSPSVSLIVSDGEELTGLARTKAIAEVSDTVSSSGLDTARLAAVRNLGLDKPEVIRRIGAIENEMRSLGLPVSSDEPSEILLRHLAIVNIGFKFEQIYRVIFGSQITALRVVNETGPHKMDVLRPYYDGARDSDPKFYGNYTFEQWLGFLVRENLIEITDGTCSITEFGKEFLIYLAQTNLPSKPH